MEGLGVTPLDASEMCDCTARPRHPLRSYELPRNGDDSDDQSYRGGRAREYGNTYNPEAVPSNGRTLLARHGEV